MIPRVRGTNFVPAEEEQLTRSWLHVIQTPSPKGEALWDRVEAHYNAHAKAQRRSHRSLSTKWGIIQHDLSSFVRALAIEKQQFLGEAVHTEDGDGGSTEAASAGTSSLSSSLAPLSTAQESELIAKALVRYSESSVNQHSQFAYLHVWRILKDVPQWQDHLDRRMSLEAPGAASAAAVAAASVMGPMEPKTKRAKRQAERISSGIGRVSNTELKPDVTSELRVQSPAVGRASSPSNAGDTSMLLATAALKKAEALELQAHVALFATPMGSLEDEDAKEFFRHARAQVLAKLKRRRPSE